MVKNTCVGILYRNVFYCNNLIVQHLLKRGQNTYSVYIYIKSLKKTKYVYMLNLRFMYYKM